MTDFHKEEHRFLSNFYPCTIHYEGDIYTSTEHAYQAAKTLLRPERDVIRNCTNPGQSKRLGRRITLRPDWEEIKLSVMEDLLRRKFYGERLRERLLSTGDRPLIEGNTWHDNFWGDCSCPRCAKIPGKNHLGKLLMQIRSELCQDAPTGSSKTSGVPETIPEESSSETKAAKTWLKDHEDLFSPIPSKPLPNNKAVQGTTTPEYKPYAGIGSRETPDDVLTEMEGIATHLEKMGYTLRSGGAQGADSAFERGVTSLKEIFLPNEEIPLWCFEEIKKYVVRGNFDSFRPYVKNLLARNMLQIEGVDRKTPSLFVVCWTADGLASGGTGYAIRAAQAKGIPVYNLYNDGDRERFLSDILKREE
ncbi:MAG: NADAR family protein [Alphaproteobacteria bacterium]|nr:NADAR family protein [Alphaproteobacteria bacterium]